MKCQHQFFETNKVVEHPESMDWKQLTTKQNFGCQVICALCGERRRLHENGDIIIYNKKRRVWEEK